MESKKIVVCSMNKAKNKAVQEVVSKYFQNFELISIETNSGVSETPMNDEEGLLGCQNRIKDALMKIDADIYISMEGIISVNTFGSYLCGWSMIYIKEANEYLSGCSAKVKIPNEIMDRMQNDVRLSKVVADFIGSSDEEIGVIGTNGVLTHGVYTRTDEFKDSITCAISSKYTIIKKKE